ncbi:hypothetical protein [Bacteroides heparinolyticus]|uniref:hypothetical protein n=1 Tax=Prevotella heparinolytica TaxID=28113 RepID=UPI0035A16CF7
MKDDKDENKIIVYLIDYKYSGKHKYDELYIDFRTEEDFEHYIETIYEEKYEEVKKEEEKENVATVVKLTNYYSNKRLRRGAYYRLNTNVLKGENRPIFVNNN